MLSEKILKSTIERIREITGADILVYDENGKVCAAACGSAAVPSQKEITAFVKENSEEGQCQGFCLVKSYDEENKLFAAAASGGSDPLMIARMTALHISGVSSSAREQMDRENFIKNLLLDNLLLVDVYSRAKKFGIEDSARRAVLLVHPSAENKRTAMETIEGIMGGDEDSIVTAVDDNGIVIIRCLGREEGYDEIKAAAEKILETLGNDGETYVSYGTVVSGLRNLSRSFKEAHMAVDVGKIFLPDRRIISYNELGIGRLIYQLPIPLCRIFIREIFNEQSPDEFDEETIATINKFFENNLNVSETSRQLYIHRNTLVYRLDKLQKTTGLDLRVFEDAITLKIAMMVVKYMKYKENDRRRI